MALYFAIKWENDVQLKDGLESRQLIVLSRAVTTA